MATKLAVIVVEIHWFHTIERIRLDLASLHSNRTQILDSFEQWPDENLVIDFRPRATYCALDNGWHRIKLCYRQTEHEKWKDENLLWGESLIDVSGDCSVATAEWSSDPKNSRYDGRAKSCVVFKEKISATKAHFGKARIAQQKFKNALLKFGQKCEISGETLLDVIDAAHIQDVQYGGPDLPENGILLRADLHRLFDKGYFSIQSDGSISVHENMPPTYVKELRGKSLCDSSVRRIAPYLAKRRERNP